MPIVDKNIILYITQNITPEETRYVANLKSTLSDVNVDKDKEDDIIFLTKIMAFTAKISNLCLSESDGNKQMKLENFKFNVEYYKNDIYKQIQSITNSVIDGGKISKLELPISNNILEILNELKMCLHNWFTLHKDDLEYEGARALTSQFLILVHKAIYEFRLLKVSDKNYADNMELPNPNVDMQDVHLNFN